MVKKSQGKASKSTDMEKEPVTEVVRTSMAATAALEGLRGGAATVPAGTSAATTASAATVDNSKESNQAEKAPVKNATRSNPGATSRSGAKKGEEKFTLTKRPAYKYDPKRAARKVDVAEILKRKMALGKDMAGREGELELKEIWDDVIASITYDTTEEGYSYDVFELSEDEKKEFTKEKYDLLAEQVNRWRADRIHELADKDIIACLERIGIEYFDE